MGEALSLALKATDASGEVWVENTYSYRTSKYAYDPDAPQGQDPFQPLSMCALQTTWLRASKGAATTVWSASAS